MRRVAIGLIVVALLVLGFKALPEQPPPTSGQSNIERVIDGAEWALSSPSASRPISASDEATYQQIVEVIIGILMMVVTAQVVGFVSPR